MSRSKSTTPAVESHPAHQLTFVDEEIRNQLLKTPVQLLLEAENYKAQLKDLRNDWRYAFVLQWLYYFRGAVRLSGETFSVDLVEEELVGLTEANLINKISTNLASVLLGTKVTPEDFSFRVRYLFGDTLTLLGTEDEPKEFNQLSFIDKFDVLYSLIEQLQYTEAFRKQVEKYERENELRFEPIFEKGEESYFLLSDNRIYHRIIKNFPKVNIPRKFKHAKNFNAEVELDQIEPEFEWEVKAIGIYEIHDFLNSIKSNKKLKSLFQNIKQYINDLALEDLTTRKKIVKRKREQQLHDLVSHRKRSSRLQEREEQNKAEREKLELQLELERQQQAKIKLARKLKQKESFLKKEIEQRLRQQQQQQTTSRRNITNLNEDTPKPTPIEEEELKEGEWLFECYCGIREKNYDDGVKLIVCERCSRWQHLKCQDRSVQQELLRNSNDVFICNWCKQDFEVEVLQKLEEEKIQLQKEAEEKQRQRELQKQRLEEERLRQEEEERLRKEELEKERQRRILDREKLKESSVPISLSPPPIGTFSSNTNGYSVPVEQPIEQFPTQPQVQPQPHSQGHIPHQVQVPVQNRGPVLGTFQTLPSYSPPPQPSQPSEPSQLQAPISHPTQFANPQTPVPVQNHQFVPTNQSLNQESIPNLAQTNGGPLTPKQNQQNGDGNTSQRNNQNPQNGDNNTSPSHSFSIKNILE